MNKKIIYIIFSIIIFLISIFGCIRVFKIITRFEYDNLPKINFEESTKIKDECSYIFYTLDNDSLTDYAIGSIYDLYYSMDKKCNIYVVYMNELINQEGFNMEISNNITLNTLPTLIKKEKDLIIEIKEFSKK
ncbi:MAG: hypothetical protein ACRC5R_04730 [Mycoplasmatales bacterium]